MTPSSHRPGPASAPRARDAGVGRPAGMAIAAVTAAIVFVAGRPLLPHHVAPKVEPPPAAPVASPPPPPPSPPEAAADAAAADGGAAVVESAGSDAGSGGAAGKTAGASASASSPDAALKTAAAEPKPTPPSEAEPESEEAEPSAAPTKSSKAPASSAAATQADRDAAHAAWRANRPDIRVSGSKATIIIPIKGSAAGGFYKLVKNGRIVFIVLPHASSLNTMHFYRLKRHGFLTLWTDQAETNPRPKDGTKLRLIIGVRAEPQVDFYDDFVRVTIPRPDSSHSADASDDGGNE